MGQSMHGGNETCWTAEALRDARQMRCRSQPEALLRRSSACVSDAAPPACGSPARCTGSSRARTPALGRSECDGCPERLLWLLHWGADRRYQRRPSPCGLRRWHQVSQCNAHTHTHTQRERERGREILTHSWGWRHHRAAAGLGASACTHRCLSLSARRGRPSHRSACSQCSRRLGASSADPARLGCR
jgi:hypothetical protein